MRNIDDINLSPVEKTLFIPLFGKAIENKKKNPILIDKKALEIIENIDINIDTLKNGIGNIFFCLRARIIDNFLNNILESSRENIVLHLGCGLDSRCNRIDINNIDWYDIDFEDVIEIRKKYYKETKNYHLLATSILEKEWLEKIPKKKNNYIVVSEGVFQYLEEEQIKELIQTIKKYIGKYTLIFDTINKFSLKLSGNDKSVKNSGVKLHFGIDNGYEIQKWNDNIKLIKEHYLSFSEINGGNIFLKMLLKIVNIIPKIKGFFRILIFTIE